MTLADLPSLAAVLQDERVMYAYEGAFSDAETALWMQKQFRRYQEYGFGLWAVVLKDTREMIGQCGITLQEYKGKQVPEIGYLLAHGHWHRGYAAEAAVACREYGFNTLNFNALYSIIRDTNVSSQQVALRNGMTLVDTIVKFYRGVRMPHWSIVFRRQMRLARRRGGGNGVFRLPLPLPLCIFRIFAWQEHDERMNKSKQTQENTASGELRTLPDMCGICGLRRGFQTIRAKPIVRICSVFSTLPPSGALTC